MSQDPFPHDGSIYIVGDDRFEVAYDSLGYLKYKRIREHAIQHWQDTTPIEIDADQFWMVVACIERARD